MTTRAEMVRECSRDVDCEHNLTKLLLTAATLTRDGELREGLKKLVEEWESKAIDLVRGADDAEVGLTLRDCSRELSSLLKEEGNG